MQAVLIQKKRVCIKILKKHLKLGEKLEPMTKSKFQRRDYHVIMNKIHQKYGTHYYASNAAVSLATLHKGHVARAVSPIAFQEVAAYLQCEGMSPDKASEKSYHAVKLFRSSDRVLQYLQKWGEANGQALSQLLNELPEIKSRHTNLQKWGDAILQQGPRMMEALRQAPDMVEPKRRYTHGYYSIRETQSSIDQAKRTIPKTGCTASFEAAQNNTHEKTLFDPQTKFSHGLPMKH